MLLPSDYRRDGHMLQSSSQRFLQLKQNGWKILNHPAPEQTMVYGRSQHFTVQPPVARAVTSETRRKLLCASGITDAEWRKMPMWREQGQMYQW